MKLLRALTLVALLSGCSVRLVDDRIEPENIAKAFSERDNALKEIGKLLELHESKIKALEEKK